MHREKVNLKRLNGVFNWTMTYRRDSDIPMPYGEILPKEKGDEILKYRTLSDGRLFKDVFPSGITNQNITVFIK